MELTPTEVDDVTSQIYKFELSYETVSHMKVVDQYDMVLALPAGKKGYLWFSHDNVNHICYLLETNRNKKIVRGQITPMKGHKLLSLGTLVYGTIITSEDTDDISFICEDLFFYEGESFVLANNMTKFHYMSKLINSIQPHTENYHIYMPITWLVKSDEEFTHILPEHIANKFTYNVHHLQYRSSHTKLPYVNVFTNRKLNPVILPAQPKQSSMFQFDTLPFKMSFKKPQYRYTTTFQVVADIQYDIYHLFAYGKNNGRVYYNIAYIPTYKTSVFLNGVFRNIRENNNLDYIEESDDEEDFENINEDKYVNLSKVVSMECVFHFKFKKWVPQKVVYNNKKVVHISQL